MTAPPSSTNNSKSPHIFASDIVPSPPPGWIEVTSDHIVIPRLPTNSGIKLCRLDPRTDTLYLYFPTHVGWACQALRLPAGVISPYN
jgi:hypothetical protein